MACHVLHIKTDECQLKGDKELVEVWRNMSDSISSLSTIDAPFAKIDGMPCLVAMTGTVAAALTLPFDKLKGYEGTEETTLASILTHYSLTFSNMIERRTHSAMELSSTMSDSIAVTLGCVATSASIATPIWVGGISCCCRS